MLGTAVGKGWFYSLVLDVLLFRQALQQHLGVSGDIAAHSGSSGVTLPWLRSGDVVAFDADILQI